MQFLPPGRVLNARNGFHRQAFEDGSAFRAFWFCFGGRGRGELMAWVVLVAAGVMESVWAIALEKSQGFTQLIPSIVFIVALVLSMVGLSYA